ncbi:hypothetical protein FNV43_RR08898 [Rhamnella rubrinervis]|uniref:Uncharacterized protein n=1 Tax=Rhamnella rubrinervis TaxID=2594499 RepID=A0A8K0H913_9ROSA|nr:hypothetical protein FNV43_RR08898 [Rhamnella rubrinervis]
MVRLENSGPAIEINGLRFTYSGIYDHPLPRSKPLINNFSFPLNAEIAAFLSDLTTLWRRDVTFTGFEVPIQMDISVEKMIFEVGGIDPQGRSKLIKANINLSWRLHKVSDGQRRWVQICMRLLKPFKVLLLDEITVFLDVLAWDDLLKFLRRKCEEFMLLRKERDEESKRWEKREARGPPKFEEQKERSHVIGDPARALNNGLVAGRLHSIITGEDNFVFSFNRVLRN